jgi:hypothetical protein
MQSLPNIKSVAQHMFRTPYSNRIALDSHKIPFISFMNFIFV